MQRLWGAARVCLVLSAGSLCSCAAKQAWFKPGSGQTDFTQARYVCLQQSQQSFGTAYIGRYGGSANSGMTTNEGLFGACMNSQGWSLQAERTPEQIADDKATTDAFMVEYRELCTRPDFQAHYRKTPCLASDPTLDQLADKSRISAAEKTALSAVRAENFAFNKRVDESILQRGGTAGPAVVKRREENRAAFDLITMEFYEGKITRGEYNTRRKEMDARSK